MRNKARQSRTPRQVPLDHLRRGEQRPVADSETAIPLPPPADDPDAARGKDTRTPAAVATREHLEGSEQGPA